MYYVVYYSRMAQPKEPPLSIRPGAQRLASIDAFAKANALSRHLAIMVLLDRALAMKGGAADLARASAPPKRLPAPAKAATAKRKPIGFTISGEPIYR